MPIDTSVGRKGWRQGCILRQDDHSKFGAGVQSFLRPETRLIVVSHDCDVTNDSFDKEPSIELLIASPATDKMGGRKHGKNPRVIEFPITLNGLSVPHIAQAKDRFVVDRRLFASITPDPQADLLSETRDLLRSWLAARYNRSAFPDEFLRRIGKVSRDLESLFDKQGSNISAIFVGIKPAKDARAEEPYEVCIYAVMPVEMYKQINHRSEALDLVDKLGKLLRGCKGIDLVDAELRAESEITLDDMRYLKRFTYEYLSHKNPQDSVNLPTC